MTFTMVHIGDLHLQSTHARSADRLGAFDQIINESIDRRDLAAWLIPGDIFHMRSNAQDRNDVAARLQRMANRAPVLLAYGNHDIPLDLNIFAKLNSVWPITVIDRPQTVHFAVPGGVDVSCFVLPYPSRAGLVAAGVPPSEVAGAARQALEVIFMKAAAELQEAEENGSITLAMAHVNVAGSVSSSGQPQIGVEIELDPTLIARLRGRYLACNHIHRAQEIGGATYAGSCCRLDFGEREPKRYLTITYGKGDQMREGATTADGWLFNVESHQIDVAPMIHVTGELTREGFTWAVKDGDPPSSFEGAEVRCRYTFNADEKTALDDAIVREPFLGAKRLELDPIAVRNRASRAPEVAAALTTDAKVQAFVGRSGVTWTPAMEAKWALLQSSPDGAAFLTQVQHGLSGAAEVSPATGGVTSAAPGNQAGSSEPAPDKELSGVLL